ncbi:MAG: alpha-hydroxy acid oxidase [Gemmatimonadetes bacterium]|nr:alpha-hydroxy acid oxidase [Gemmatimonadota bacterium]MDA1102353.1 alpha-hydroxy acid oxidase [Gemmatimonadota bacterium]
MTPSTSPRDVQRRHFLRWLAASPLLASAGGLSTFEDLIAQEAPRRTFDDLVTTAQEALDVFDLEKVAASKVPLAHWGYIMTGVDGEETQANNRAALERIYLRARRMIDVSRLDTRVTLLGREWPSPLLIAPAGSQRAFHPDGELATARAASARNHLQTLSTVTSTAVEEVNRARGEPVWYQLYARPNWNGTVALVQRVRDAGCPVIVLTVDLNGGSNRLTVERYGRIDERDCESCHREGGRADPVKPMLRGLPTGSRGGADASMTWDYIHQLRDITDQKIVVKGLVTSEDAELAVGYGVDAIWVSNHGGRAEGSGRGTVDALPEIAQAVAGRMPIIVDGGFRRGTDLFKGLARGATAVAIGRPYLWGLGAFGQEGIERVLEILTRELEITMRAVGTPSLADIGPHSIGVD